MIRQVRRRLEPLLLAAFSLLVHVACLLVDEGLLGETALLLAFAHDVVAEELLFGAVSVQIAVAVFLP